jgi:hypothetical protein
MPALAPYTVASRPIKAIRPYEKNPRILPPEAIEAVAGSGSTLIAAEQLGRQARLMEIDPVYCDVIVQRWEQFTGKTLEKLPQKSGEDQASPTTAVT